MRLTRWLAAECVANRTGAVMAVLFLAVAVPLAVFCAMLVPPGNVADEPAHAARAAAVAHGGLVGYRRIQTDADGDHLVSGVDTDQALLQLGFLFRPFGPNASAVATPQRRAAGAAIRWGETLQFGAIGVIASYFPVFYLPSATALYVARHTRMHVADGFLMARLCNVAALALIGAAALFLARRGHGLLFCVLAAPMTVSLAASFNQDGLAIATAVLAAALLTRQGGGRVGRSLPAAAFCLLCVALAKPTFVPFAALLLTPLPPPRGWPGQRRVLAIRGGLMLLVAVPVLLWSAYVASHVVGSVPHPVYEAGPLWPGPRPAPFNGTDAAAQMTVLTAHPLRFVTLSWQAIAGQPLAREMIGVLGWLDVTLPRFLYWLWGAAGLAAILGALAGPAPRPRWPDLVLVPLVLLATAIALATGVYLTWIPVGGAVNDGMQGRYLLPLVPMLVLVLPGLGLPAGRMLRAAGLALPVLAGLAGLITVPGLLVTTYYLH